MKKLRPIVQILSILSFLTSATANERINILAIMPNESVFINVLDGIRSELGSSYNINILDINKVSKATDAVKQCKETQCQALILMDSKAVNLAKGMQASDSSMLLLPKFVLMTLMVELATHDLQNVAGVKFEIPAYTLVTNFRIISEKDFSKVGVFYRKKFKSVIDEATKLLAKEQITLSGLCIDCNKQESITATEALQVMKDGLDNMIKQEKVEVFWLMADNILINPSSILEFWLGKVKQRKIPVIAPLENMASPQIGAAVFTADPDYTQLGAQAANEIIQVFEEHQAIIGIGFEATISIKSALNVKVAKEINWNLKQEKLNRVNKIIAP